MKSLALSLALAGTVLSLGSVAAVARDRGHYNEPPRYHQDAGPVYRDGRQWCQDVAVERRYDRYDDRRDRHDRDRKSGMVAGAIVGGLIGNQVGSGSGRTAATVAGAVAGGAIGNRAQNGRDRDRYDDRRHNDRYGRHEQVVYEQRCWR